MDDTLGSRVRHRARERRSAPEAATPIRSDPASDSSTQACPGHPRGLHLPDGWLFGLLVPADLRHECTLLMLRNSAAGLSDALGGALLDECAVDGRPTHRCWVYLDAARRDRQLPRNRQLERLAPALGWPRDQSVHWLGPALITGRDLHWADRDVPSVVLAAALPPD